MAQRREPGVLVLAKELNGAIEKHVEDREYSPTYLISEIGGKLSRVLIGGVLDQLENRGSESDPFASAEDLFAKFLAVPTPLSFTPPKGTRKSRCNQVLTQTIPVSIFSANFFPRTKSEVHTDPANP